MQAREITQVLNSIPWALCLWQCFFINASFGQFFFRFSPLLGSCEVRNIFSPIPRNSLSEWAFQLWWSWSASSKLQVWYKWAVVWSTLEIQIPTNFNLIAWLIYCSKAISGLDPTERSSPTRAPAMLKSTQPLWLLELRMYLSRLTECISMQVYGSNVQSIQSPDFK